MASKRKKIDFTQEPPQKMADCPFYGYQLDKEQIEFAEAIYSNDIDIVFCNSPAGTGKDLVAVGTANIMVQFGLYDEIIYVVSPYGERKQGYLPGDIQSKSSVYFDPLYQALIACGVNPNTAVNQDGLTGDKTGGYITCMTDTYIRGVTFTGKKILVVDESQNLSFDQLKKVIDVDVNTVKWRDVMTNLMGKRFPVWVSKKTSSKGKEYYAICALGSGGFEVAAPIGIPDDLNLGMLLGGGNAAPPANNPFAKMQ